MIFLGLIDMGIVNAFIMYHWARQRCGDAPADDAKFLEQLQMQLIQVSSDDFLDEMRGLGKKRHRRSSVDAEEENEDEAAEEAAVAEDDAEGEAAEEAAGEDNHVEESESEEEDI
ncbi:unnamed protein product [Phytophthora fragariaefolia]|uniref:Unnamed protein product n=1 Tax=Phytophthora fragariaefolia TaxID=1490495 RepID=A0A9W6U9A7_9STRA|nr:unnamed protein product [Phytophthora fragariaefolia]